MPVTKQDVLHALLALDAYNRHRTPEVRKIGEADRSPISINIGEVTWQNSSDNMETSGAPSQKDALKDSTTSGFSASFYDQGGKTIISYRGTDFDFSSMSGFVQFVQDVFFGWTTSLGVFEAEGVSVGGVTPNKAQPYYALKFFETVTGARILLSDEQWRQYRDASERVSDLEQQKAAGESVIAEADALLPQAQADAASSQQIFDDAVAAAAAGIVGEIDTLEEAELQATLNSATLQYEYHRDQLTDLQARRTDAIQQVAVAEAALPAARATLDAVKPKFADGAPELVGHSLGGSLAGFVGSLTDEQAVVFNEIPYSGMALTFAIEKFLSDNIIYGADVVLAALGQIATGQAVNVPNYNVQPFMMPSAESIKAFRMLGEIAAATRYLDYGDSAFNLGLRVTVTVHSIYVFTLQDELQSQRSGGMVATACSSWMRIMPSMSGCCRPIAGKRRLPAGPFA